MQFIYDVFRPFVIHYLFIHFIYVFFDPSNAELNPICHLLALLGAHHILHVSRVRVDVLLM
jgi:hypothetical protein